MKAIAELCNGFINDPDTDDGDFVMALTSELEELNHDQLITVAKAICGWGRP